MNSDKKELTSAFTHLGGAVFGIIGTILLINVSRNSNNSVMLVAFLIFGISMVLMYSTSTTYHLIDKSKEKAKLIMRKLDHIMIFVFVAGSYTPICLLILNNSVGYRLLALVWSITLIGVIIKLCWITAPNWVSSLLYISMGWVAILVLSPLSSKMPSGGMYWLIWGGVLYTIGGVIYGLKRPNINKSYFGFHELFHIFVLAGSLCHYVMMYFYIG
ncbi:hemolysin III family protein [Sedimentibacter sp.]|uniref:PAQR family membrane homeostasis protein TrhA n=1 Tax=Sedimentibacter sp. TaxID=1960295 RepID=UPI00289C88E1|nr:hemolysin III family protein [Sedimentibacter sp.]